MAQARPLDFRRGKIMQSFYQQRRKCIFNEDKIVVLLGLARDYHALVENFYTTEDPSQRALVGGAIISFLLSVIDNQELIQHHRVCDIIDVFKACQKAPGHLTVVDAGKYLAFSPLGGEWKRSPMSPA